MTAEKSTIKKFPFIPVLIGLLVAYLLFMGFRWYTARAEGRAKVSEAQSALIKSKKEMTDAYVARISFLESWSADLAKSPKKFSQDLALSEDIKQSKDLKLESQADLDRFDFVQNQVSEKISKYIAKDPQSANLREMQKIEENINHQRKEYHRTAFLIEDLNRRYRLSEVNPLVFKAERLLKEKNLF